jgi:hypothetical protein
LIYLLLFFSCDLCIMNQNAHIANIFAESCCKLCLVGGGRTFPWSI